MRGSGRRSNSWSYLLAAPAALTVALAPPTGYFIVNYSALASTLETVAEFKAGVVTDIISRSPEIWKFQEHRLEELLARRVTRDEYPTVRILDRAGETIASVGPPAEVPGIVRSANLFDAGILVGRVEVAGSLRGLLLETAGVLLLGALLGAGLWVQLRLLIRRDEELSDALFEEKERAEVTLRSIVEGVVATGANDAIEYLNPAAETLTGWRLAGARGRRVDEVLRFAGDDTDPRPGQRMLLRPDGSRLSIEISAAPIRDREGRAIGEVLVLRDIGERRKAEEAIRDLNAGLEDRVRERTAELERANRDLESFAYSVSHDLRAPLRSIAGFSNIVNERYREALPPEARDYLQRIAAGASKMGRLVDGLLEFARLGRVELKEAKVRPADLARDALADYADEIRRRGVELRFGELPECVADPVLLRQVYGNLIGNALKYSARRERAEIEIGSCSAEGETVYFVRDNGAGFEPQYAGKLFGMFERLHSPAEFEGEGIGLATVQRIIQRHGGRVWAESAPDKGAIFYFTV